MPIMFLAVSIDREIQKSLIFFSDMDKRISLAAVVRNEMFIVVSLEITQIKGNQVPGENHENQLAQFPTREHVF